MNPSRGLGGRFFSRQFLAGERCRQAAAGVRVARIEAEGFLELADCLVGPALLKENPAKIGMSQRGGSVASDVRFGARVFSPMVSAGEADFLLVLDAGQIEVNRAMLAPRGVLIEPGMLAGRTLRSSKALNVALLGALSRSLDFSEELWTQALRDNLAPKLLELNLQAFDLGRTAAA